MATLRFAVILLILTACANPTRHAPGGPYYFAAWSGYGAIRTPEQPVSHDAAIKLDTYYEAHFDDRGRLISFKKYFHGALEWADTYEYDGNRLALRRVSKPSGEVTEQRFDP